MNGRSRFFSEEAVEFSVGVAHPFPGLGSFFPGLRSFFPGLRSCVAHPALLSVIPPGCFRVFLSVIPPGCFCVFLCLGFNEGGGVEGVPVVEVV